MKKHLLTLLVLFVPIILFAQQFEYSGLWYNILNTTDKTVEVIPSNSSTYTGDITIPTYIQYNGVDYKVIQLGRNSFYSCKDITSVALPSSIEVIGDYAFCYLEKITSITIPENVREIGQYAFKDCKSLASIDVPDKITTIKDGAFEGCSSITTFTIPETLTELAQYLFEECTSLTSITIPKNITKIGYGAFSDCSGLTSFIIPETVTEIGGAAFQGCTGLTEITIPNSITEIYLSTFASCTNLASVTLPETLTMIDDSAFHACKSLTSIQLPNSITEIGHNVFMNCTSLTEITLPEKITFVGGGCFQGCTSLTSISIPSSTIELGAYAFSGCTSLVTVELPNGLKQIGYEAFAGCTKLSSISIPETVTSMGQYTFSNCKSLTSITIPKGIKTLVTRTFSNCTNLSSVTLQEGLEHIQAGVFESCQNLRSITLPTTLEEIGEYAFKECNSLTSITIPEKVTTIAWQLFLDCSNLTSVDIKGDIKIIGAEAFENCDNLSDINIPTTVTTIQNRAFWWCNNLTSIVLPEGLESIETFAFAGAGLTSVDIPESVKSMQEGVFAYNDNLKYIKLKSTTPPSIYNLLYKTPQVSLYIPCGAMENYLATDWKDYSSQLEEHYEPIVTTNSTNNSFGTTTIDKLPTCDDNSAIISAVPNDHYHFVEWLDGNTDNPRTIVVTDDVEYTAAFAINQYTISTKAENGIVIGGGEYTYGQEVTLTANANDHYHFVQWNDGNTDNPRKIIASRDITYTAEFALDMYMITGDAKNGTIEGLGEYAYGSEIQLTAIPNEHYHFVQWNDGNTDNPRKVVVEGDMSFLPIFAPNEYTITLEGDVDMGSVMGQGTYEYGTTITIGAIANAHYRFVQWSDGNADNPRRIVVEGDMLLTAEFALDSHMISGYAEHGTIEGLGEYEHGQEIMLTATADEHYHFVAWSDGNTDNPRSIIVTENVTLTAIFSLDNHMVIVECNEDEGSVLGGGEYVYGSTAVLEAQPKEGYIFSHWSDENTDNPRNLLVEGDVDLVAYFELVTPTSLGTSSTNENVRKVVRNGQVLIVRGGKTYNTEGVEVQE